MRLVLLIHILLSIAGAALCAIRGLEGGGALILCFSAMALMIVKVDHIISIDTSCNAPDLPADLERANGLLNTIYRRTITLANVIEVAANRKEPIPPQLGRVLRSIDSSDPHIDSTIHDLRDRILTEDLAPSHRTLPSAGA